MSMAKSKIGYTNDKVSWYYGWNPGGFGCSGGCECCWARPLGRRMSCPDCKAFRVHLHPERLDWPARTRTPGVVLVNFTCDTFDRQRDIKQVSHIAWATERADHHVYVWLTQNAERALWVLRKSDPLCTRVRPNHYFGCTIRTQAESDERLPVFLQIPGKLWLSLEPLCSDIALCDQRAGAWIRSYGDRVKGVIVGHDNRQGAPGTDTLKHIRSVVEQCKAAGVAVYVKQIHHDGKFLRASHPHEYAMFPPDLKQRELPWAMPAGTKELATDGK